MPEPLDYSSLRDPRPHHPAVYTVLSVILWTVGAVVSLLTLLVFLFGLSAWAHGGDLRFILIVIAVGTIFSAAAFLGSALLCRRA
jgi:hypothetical protein